MTAEPTTPGEPQDELPAVLRSLFELPVEPPDAPAGPEPNGSQIMRRAAEAQRLRREAALAEATRQPIGPVWHVQSLGWVLAALLAALSLHLGSR